MDTKTLYAKLATIPPQIKSWLSSEAIVDYVNNLDDQFILPGESSSIIKKIAQRLLVKDLAPEYFSGELAMELKLDKDKATHISSEIKKNIFFPQKAILSNYGIDIDLLDKFQMPVIKQSTGDSPKILEDVEPIIMSSTKPTTLSDIGWSKQAAATPVPLPVPKPAAEPAPMMLHEDTTFKPAEKNVGFTLSKPGGAAEMSINHGTPQAAARPAVLEFGGGATSAGTSVPKPPTPTSSSMRPLGFGPSFASAPTANSGTRNVSQIVPTTSVPIPKPPVAPTPQKNFAAGSIPMPIPRPPQAPQKSPAQQNAIVKDFI